ncbi:MAG: hypothetical protein KF841_12120 [Phycisphaerae bacterium]|nr:hypothetical protein [Phycisphaerae bacterium]
MTAKSTLRAIRRRITATVIQTACDAAPFVPEPLIRFAQDAIAGAGPLVPPLASLVRRNMRSAGITRPKAVRDYFKQAALHLFNGVRIFHYRRCPERIREIARRETQLDESVHDACNVLASGRGGILAPAHCSNYLISLVRLREVLPLSIYLRWSKDQRKVELKRKWCEAAGLDVIIEPRDAANPVGSAMICADAIRAGKVLAITPDLVQEANNGTPVRMFDRIGWLPTGPASLAMLCEAPLIPIFTKPCEDQQLIYAGQPITVPLPPRSEGGRHEGVRRAMQAWADGFVRYVQNSPHLWFLWADNRWTRFFSNDPEYAAPAAAAKPAVEFNDRSSLNSVPESRKAPA